MKHPDVTTRKKVVAAYYAGNSITHLVSIFGFHRNSIRKWIKLEKISPEKLVLKAPGRGRPSIFDRKSGAKLLKIISKPASVFGFETDFWTTGRLQVVCKEKLGLKISRMAIHRSLVKFEQSYKKPQKRFFEANTEKQTEWVNRDLKKIKNLVKSKKAILYFEDESAVDLSPVLAKTWGPIGEKIIQKVTANRGSVSAISAVSACGHLLFNIHEAGKRFGANDIIDFLNTMLKHHPRRHLVVVMDQAPCHRAKKVIEYIQSQKRLHVFYLPPRSPEFNPDEKIWSHLKHHELKSHGAKTTEKLRRLTKKKMKFMAKDPRKVVGIFRRCEMAHLYVS